MHAIMTNNVQETLKTDMKKISISMCFKIIQGSGVNTRRHVHKDRFFSFKLSTWQTFYFKGCKDNFQGQQLDMFEQ